MDQANYLRSKITVQARPIEISENVHNPHGWVESPSGQAYTLVKKQNIEKGPLCKLKKLIKRMR
jgi:hypothetical protein